MEAEKEYWDKVEEELRIGIIGSKTDCPNYPCHFEGQDCSLCFCPFYPCEDPELGKFVTSRKGGEVWSCMDCFWTHRPEVAKEVVSCLRPGSASEELAEVKSRVEKVHLKNARTIMVMGATSGAGKSLTVAAFCRILADKGLKVTPFKSQNMSLNSVVTAKGEEIARAQALQAAAARVQPNVHMNPILLKPKKDDISQVIVEGRPYKDMNVDQYFSSFTQNEGLEIIKRNYDLLRRTNDVIVVEGAGSPAEINISDQEIANMRTAEITNASCVLVVNIEWGGAFAYIYGTLNLLKPEWKALFKGVIINNMRGDSSSLKSGIEIVERETGVPVLGVVPHLDHNLPSEDSMTLRSFSSVLPGPTIGVLRLPRISNFTDFDALGLEEGVSVRFLDAVDELDSVDAIIIPGTKNTILDLQWMKENGMFQRIQEMAHRVPLLGICGGYQMLGSKVIDAGLEGDIGQEVEGLDLLNAVTYFDSYDKRTVQVEGELLAGEGGRVRGYEIHMGKTLNGGERSLFSILEADVSKLEGSISGDGMIMGTYLHGVFDLPPFRKHFLGLISHRVSLKGDEDYDASVESSLGRLAKLVEENIDMKSLLSLLNLEG